VQQGKSSSPLEEDKDDCGEKFSLKNRFSDRSQHKAYANIAPG